MQKITKTKSNNKNRPAQAQKSVKFRTIEWQQ